MGGYVQVQGPTGVVTNLLPGDVIGRHWASALQIEDRRVSEAHAMVSLRGSALHLLNLRGALRVDGKQVRDPELADGQSIELAPGVRLTVVQVHVPPEALWLVGKGVEVQLSRGLCLRPGYPVIVEPGQHREAELILWTDGVSWFADIGSQTSRPVVPGDTFRVNGWTGTIEARALETPALTQQRAQRALTVRSKYQTVHIWPPDGAPITVSGIIARMLHELIEIDGPVHWEVLADLVWPNEAARYQLRRRYDTVIARLRRLLRDGGVRADLVRPDGCGNIEIIKYPEDTFILDD